MNKKIPDKEQLLEENVRLKKELEELQSRLSDNSLLLDSELDINHSFLKTVFDAIQNGILVLDMNFNVILTNKWMEENYKNATPVHGYRCYQSNEEENTLCENCPAKFTRESGLPASEEFSIDHDGKSKWIEVSTFPVKNKAGDIINIIEYVKDITQTKYTKNLLIEKESFISAIANTSPAIIQVFDIQKMKHVYINNTVETLLGYTIKEIKSIEAFADDGILHPDDRDDVYSSLLKISKSVHDEVFELVFRLKHKDNEYRTFRTFIRPFLRNKKGQIIQLIGISIDITEQQLIYKNLKDTSYKLSNVALAANDGMWDWYLETGKTFFDARYFTMAGYKVDDFPHNFFEFKRRAHPSDYDEIIRRLRDHLEGKTERFTAEFRFKRKDGSWMWILGRGKIAERNEDGDPVRLLGTHTDITELKKIQNDLREAKNKAEESDRLKSAFLANMSHEIRTPMNGILGFADLLSDENLSRDEINEYVAIIKKSGQRMLATINDIIDISKIESGQIDIIAGDLDINKQLEYLHNFFLPEAKKKGILLNLLKSPSGKSIKIRTDQTKFNAILTNLIKNAIKFTEKGEIQIGYQVKEKEIEFYVTDTGIGIPEDRLEAIFDRFVQADLTTTKPYEGSGLGLSISKGYIELLGGRIWTESKIGKGSTFRFTHPYRKTRMDDSVKEKELTEKQLTVLDGKSVLIVDDETNAVIYLRELLKHSCKEIIIAKSGEEAVKICRDTPKLDLILMDIKMPEMDGYAATRQIRSFNKDILIIAQTAFALQGDREKVIAAGCNDYLAKPINRNELIRVVASHLKK